MKSLARTQKRHGSYRHGRMWVEALKEESQDRHPLHEERCAAVHKRAELRPGLFEGPASLQAKEMENQNTKEME